MLNVSTTKTTRRTTFIHVRGLAVMPVISGRSVFLRVYFVVKICEGFLCFVAIVRVGFYYADFFVFFVLHHVRNHKCEHFATTYIN